jgi:hypothetical protein
MPLEGKPKALLVSKARRAFSGFSIFRHEDNFTHGIPDISITGLGITSWWEVKLADPSLDAKEFRGVQYDTMISLEVISSFARYIIFELNPKTGEKATRIVRPQHFHTWKSSGVSVAEWDYKWVITQMLRVHASKGQTVSC